MNSLLNRFKRTPSVSRGMKKPKYGGGMVHKPTALGRIADIVIIAVLLLVMFCCIIPLWHVLMASFSDPGEIRAQRGTVGGILWKPVGDFSLLGYEYIFRDTTLLKGFANTIMYVVGGTLLGMIINITAGYVLSRKSKLRPLLMIFVTLTIMFNGGMIPTYKVIFSLGFLNTPLALLIPGCTNAFFVIMLCNAFRSVPDATIEAAEIDGAGHLRIMFQVMLPQAITFTTVIILNSVVLQWNSWFPAHLYLDVRAMQYWPLQTWIKYFGEESASNGAGGGYLPALELVKYSVIIVGTLPMLVAFPFFQKQMEKGVISGAVKG